MVLAISKCYLPRSQYDEVAKKVEQQEQELFVLREKMKTVHEVEELIDRMAELEEQAEEYEAMNQRKRCCHSIFYS